MKNPNFNYTNLKERSERYGTTTIIGRKSQFKGNSVSVYTAEQNEITVVNSYYTDHTRQIYSIKDNKTIIDYNINGGFNLKWLEKKMRKTCMDLLIHPAAGITVEVIMNSNMCCNFDFYGYYLTHKESKEGLMFQGNIDNLSKLKELRHILSDVRKIIKRVNLAELVKHTIDYDTGELIQIAELIDPEDQGTRLLINYNKLLKFDRRMSDHSE
tara:strand:- start:2386 stop:3024 length:639 start_codon:yes stop_codon:yes gene_type:complete